MPSSVRIAAAVFVVAAMISRSSGRASARPIPASPETMIFYALGDSTVSGVGARSGSYADRLFARLSRAGHRLREVNLAESGATSSDLIQEQLPRVGPNQKAVAIVGIGVNDLTSGVGPEVFAKRFDTILVALRSRIAGPIVVSNLPDVSLAPAVWAAARAPLAAQVDLYNAVIARVAGRHGIAVYDVCAMTRTTLPSHPEYLSGDGYHPSDAGYQLWADGLWRILQPLM